MKDFALARRNMVQSQIETNKVTSPALLEAFSQTPRELFLPEELRDFAYMDEDIEISPGRYLMEPMVLARLLQEAEIGRTDAVLDIGGVGGYAGAVLAAVAGSVISLECDPQLAAQAAETLSALSIDTVTVVDGALENGHARHAPYDVIILGGAVPDIPKPLTSQLTEGGRLLGVVRSSPTACGRAVLALRHQNQVTQRELFDANVPFMPGFSRPKAFAF